MKFDNKRNNISIKGSAEQNSPLTRWTQLPLDANEDQSTVLDSKNDGLIATFSDPHTAEPSIKLEGRSSIMALPMSPLKRTADEAGYEPRHTPSPAADPRLTAQKRARENNT